MKETFSILDSASVVSENLFIEASAGTGKTFAIQHLVVRKVLDAKDALLPKQCAIITFTKAVAEELLSRISDSLDQAINCLKLSDTSLDYLKPFIETDEARIRALNRLLLFRRDIDSCRITTIHGFCLQLLQQYQGSSLQMIDQHQQNTLIQELIEYELSKNVLSLGQFQGVRKFYKFDDTKLLSALSGTGADIPQPQLDVGLGTIFEKHTPEEVFSTLVELSTNFTDLRDNKGNLKKEPEWYFSTVAALFDLKTRQEALYELEKSSLSLSRLFANQKKKCSPDVSSLKLLEKLQRALDKHCSTKNNYSRLKSVVQQGFERVCFTKGLFTFDLLIKRVASLAQTDDAFKSFIQEQLKVVVVDEFQDTDPEQWSLISQVFLDGAWPGNLYLVGDPKQSIYAFRSADVYSYLDAKSKIPAQKALTTNYRSTTELVTALNALFTGPWAESLFHLPKKKSSLKVDVVDSHRLRDSDESPCRFVVFNSSLGRKRTWPHHELITEQFLPWLSEELYAQKLQGYDFSQMAILVNDRYQARTIESYLESKGIPATSLKTLSVVESPAVNLLRALYGFLSNPKALHRLKELLSLHTSIFPLDALQVLDDPVEGLAAFGAYVNDAEAILKIVRKHGIASAWDAFLQCRMYPTTRSFGDDCIYTEELRRDSALLLDLLSEEEKERVCTVEDAFKHLSSLEEFYGLDSECLQRRFDPERDSVTIVTTHKSKGLEFDIVIPIGVACRSKEPSKMESDERILEREAEKARLLYVALTRARNKLMIPVFIENDEKPISFGLTAPLEKLFQAVVGSDVYTSENVLSACQKLADSSLGTIALEFPKTSLDSIQVEVPIKSPLYLPQISKPITWVQKPRTSFSKTNHGRAETGTANGRILGIFIHSLMQKLIEEIDLRDKESTEQFVFGEVNRAGFDEAIALDILRLLYSPITVSGHSFVMAELSKLNLFAESSFCIQENEKELTGAIDCLIKLENGFIVLDWKSHLVDMPLEILANSLNCVEQAKIYRKAVERTGLPCLGVAFVFIRDFKGESNVICY